MDMTRRETVAGGAALVGLAGAAKAAPPRSTPLDTHDALGLAGLVAKKQVSAGELLDAAITKAEALNPRFNFLAQKHYD